VIRVWELPVEQLLSGGVGTLALAPISAVPEGEVRAVVRRMKERLGGPNPPRRANDVWAAAYILCGLRYPDAFVHALFEEVLSMEQSTTYQAIVRRTRVDEARQLLLSLAEAKFGPPNPATRAALESIADHTRLKELTLQVLTATTWQELLPTPAAGGRRGRRRSGG
jgi:hypothetical protein